MLERFHKEPPESDEEGLGQLNYLFETGWRRTGFGSTDDELQFRDRAREALRLYWERERAPRANRSGSSASSTSRSATTTSAAASTGSTACPTATTS